MGSGIGAADGTNKYTDVERKTGHSSISVQRYLSGFTKTVRFHSRGYSAPEIRELTDISERLVKEYLDLMKPARIGLKLR